MLSRLPGDILSGYIPSRIHDDLSYYDDEPHVVVDDQYYVEATQADVCWQQPPSSSISQTYTDDNKYHSAALQVQINERF